MSNELTKFKTAGLPAVSTLGAALGAVRLAPDAGALLKYDKTGHWGFGTDHEAFEEGAQLAVNPYSFFHGWVAWAEKVGGSPMGEITALITEPLPDPGPAPAGSKGWERQAGFMVKVINGEDAGLELRYAHNSQGGLRFIQKMGTEIGAHINEDPTTPVAIIELIDGSFYNNKKHGGKTYIPDAKIVGYMTMDGEKPADVEASAEAHGEQLPKRRARR